MAQTLVTTTARRQLAALDDTGRAAVDMAVERLEAGTGKPVSLPGTPPGRTYRAITTGRNLPVIVYRASEQEPGTMVIMSLMTPREYADVQQLEELIIAQPEVGEAIEATAEALLPGPPIPLRIVHDPIVGSGHPHYSTSDHHADSEHDQHHPDNAHSEDDEHH